mmetsp:Transcript_116198/g.259745  ORF Transcript_116198/g.259745 Transcript_116198/m.259745 type:complete len:555 (+) Transcript_116198:91-1755(+)
MTESEEPDGEPDALEMSWTGITPALEKSNGSVPHHSNTSGGTLPKKHKAVFVDAKAMKDKLKENLHKPTYDVKNFYKEEGICQKIARSDAFEHITLGVIGLNALWMAIACDWQTESTLNDAHPIFIVAEFFFCAYFLSEWVMRFGAFAQKWNTIRDGWFVFDSFMLALMVFETWVMFVVLELVGGEGADLGNAGLLRLLRLLRLSRMARMVRLFHFMPELLILIKGMVAGIRSVSLTLVLLTIIIYIFAIIFRQIATGSVVGDEKFPTVLVAMHTLLLDGVLMDDTGGLVRLLEDAGGESILLKLTLLPILYGFILLASLTVMNMLIGVLVEVVSAVASTEQEGIAISHMGDKLSALLQTRFPAGTEVCITKDLFLELLQQQDTTQLLRELNINVLDLVDLVDTIFSREDGSERELTFGDFIEVMMKHRESKMATVQDFTNLRKYVRARLDLVESQHESAQLCLEEQMQALGATVERLAGARPGTFQQATLEAEKEVKRANFERKSVEACAEGRLSLPTPKEVMAEKRASLENPPAAKVVASRLRPTGTILAKE